MELPILVEEVVTTKIFHNPTVDTFEKGLEATKFDEDEANLQYKAVNNTVAKVKKPCACGPLTHSRQSHHDCPLRKKKRKFNQEL